jgi:hypothetical protein
MTETLQKPKGHFRYELIEDGKIISSFEDNNLVHHNAYRMYSAFVGGSNASFQIDPVDINIVSICLGDSSTGPLHPSENKLKGETKPTGHAYGATWLPGLAEVGALQMTNEGTKAEFYDKPVVGVGTTGASKVYYEDVIINGVSMRVPAGKIEFIFEMGTDAAETPAGTAWNEAALYMHRGKDLPALSLGLMFSSKSFPKIVKTAACTLRIVWTIDFSF